MLHPMQSFALFGIYIIETKHYIINIIRINQDE